jgi:ribosomal protein S18 acetylase RimI-like enzyme
MFTSSPMTIAPLAAQDIAPCAALMACSMPWLRYGVTEPAAKTMWTQALAEEASVAVARSGGRALGFAWYIPEGAFGRSGYLKLLGVHPDARGQGIGNALLAHVEGLARANGEPDLFLLVSDFNLPAQRFYQNAGYQHVGAIPGFIQLDIVELIYRKALEKEARP